MASEVGICNLALAHLGDEASVSSIDPSDGSVQAEHCRTFYPVARDALIEMHNWNFAMRRVALAPLVVTSQPAEWAFAYGYPSCLKMLGVYFPEAVFSVGSHTIFDGEEFVNIPKSQPFVIETIDDGSRVIYTNIENATARFLANVIDTTVFSPLFTLALSRFLASMLAGPIIKGVEGRRVAQEQLKEFELISNPRAQTSDSQAGKDTSYNDFIPGGIAARNQ